MAVEEPAQKTADVLRRHAERLPANQQAFVRRYELDWLRVAIVLGAMVFHVIYQMPLYFPQARADLLTQVGSAFALQWGLPLLFLISGASAWLSVAHRTAPQFIKQRVLHLLVPFVGCVLTVIPLTLYIASLISAGPHVPFLQFYADYFQSYAQFFQGNPLEHLIPQSGNLWFIFVIFLLSIVILPLILLLKGRGGSRVIAGFSKMCRMRGGTLLVSLIFAACAWLLGVVLSATVASTLWLAAVCVLSFVAGVMLYSDPSIEQAITRDGPAALALATLCFVTEQLLVSNHALPLPHSAWYVLTAVLAGGLPWFGTIAFLGLVRRLLGFTNRALEYLKEAVFPYFILHMLVLSGFGYIFLAQSSWPAVLQIAGIASCAALSLALLYEFVIKRNGVLRFIFGMKARARKPSQRTLAMRG